MTATLNRPRRRTRASARKARDVREVLLELAYRLHATKVVGLRPAPAARS
jgi:hypothetical protein